jgi:hypothetical protein
MGGNTVNLEPTLSVRECRGESIERDRPADVEFDTRPNTACRYEELNDVLIFPPPVPTHLGPSMMGLEPVECFDERLEVVLCRRGRIRRYSRAWSLAVSRTAGVDFDSSPSGLEGSDTSGLRHRRMASTVTSHAVATSQTLNCRSDRLIHRLSRMLIEIPANRATSPAPMRIARRTSACIAH